MPIEVFYSYSHQDSGLRDELQVHLKPLERDGLIAGWADRRLAGGDEWRSAIDEHVRSARIILLLVSPDFLASDYCYGVELKIAMERHARKEAVVIPIILRPSDWQTTPFAELQALPRDGKAVTLWPNRDEVLTQIARSLREVVTPFHAPAVTPADFASLFERQTPQARVLDAAMPSHIVKDRATELLALIRLPESLGLAGVLQHDDEADARPEDVRSKPFDVTFPLGPTGLPQSLKVTVQLTSPDFTPASQMKNIYVPVKGDSPVCAFLLTPIRTGALLVALELVWEDAERGYRRLKTNCVSEAALPGQTVMNVVRMDLSADFAALPPKHAEPPPPVMAAAPFVPPPRATKSSSFLSSSSVRAALAILVVAMGSTFFFVQRRPNAGQVTLPSTATPPAAVLEQRLRSATVEFEQARKQSSANLPIIAASIQEGQQNLAAAREALRKGDRAEARKRVAMAETVNRHLSEYVAAQPDRQTKAPEPIKSPPL